MEGGQERRNLGKDFKYMEEGKREEMKESRSEGRSID